MTDHECPSADAEAQDDTRCKSVSWDEKGRAPLLRCKLDLAHTGRHHHGGAYDRRWTDAEAEGAFEPDRDEGLSRCASTTEPLGGETVRCQDVPGHTGRHVNYGHQWGVETVVTTRYRCPVCGELFERREAAEFCGRSPYDPPAKPGDVVKLMNRNYGYTVAKIVSIRPQTRLKILGEPAAALLEAEPPERWAHETIATLDVAVRLDHKWEDFSREVELETYLFNDDDPDHKRRAEQGRDDNNGD